MDKLFGNWFSGGGFTAWKLHSWEDYINFGLVVLAGILVFVLAQRRINIASMQVFRAATGGYAVMVLECDSHIPHVLEQQMAVMPGIRKVTCLNIDEPEECEEG